MRLAFWRAGKVKAAEQRAIPKKPAPAVGYDPAPAASSESGARDLRALRQALAPERGWIIVPAALALVLSVVAVNLVTPRYKSEARILVAERDTVFLRPSGRPNAGC